MTIADAPELLKVEEAAELLRCGRSKAYAMAADGSMPGLVRVGGSVRVSRRHLLAWIDKQAESAPSAPAA
jgi:excisionase family DNA binding protein